MNRRRFLSQALTMAGVAALPSGFGSDKQATPAIRSRVIYNDDATNHFQTGDDTPLTPKHLQGLIDRLANYGVKTYAWCSCLPDCCYYNTRAGQVIGRNWPVHNEVGGWNWVANLQSIIANGHDPLKIVCDRAHQRGMQFFTTIRMNDSHHGSYGSGFYLASQFFLDHPEWRTRKPDGSFSGGMDYAIPEVRAHRMEIFREQAEDYDIDGMELDFMRWCILFQPGKTVDQTLIMTQFVREIREMLDKAAKKRQAGRLLLGARVASTLLENQNMGLDLRAMAKEGLLDYICPTDFLWTDFSIPVEQFKELVRGTTCKVYPSLLSGVGQGYPQYMQHENYRAAAHNFYSFGADGISTFNIWIGNMNDPVYAKLAEGDFLMIRDIEDPQKLAGLNRQYLFYPLWGKGGPPTVGANHENRIAFNRTQDTGKRKILRFRAAEDFEDTQRSFHFGFVGENLTVLDQVRIELNGHVINDQLRRRYHPVGRMMVAEPLGLRSLGPYYHYEMELNRSVAVKGDNELAVTLLETNPHLGEVAVDYLGRKETLQPAEVVFKELELTVKAKNAI